MQRPAAERQQGSGGVVDGEDAGGGGQLLIADGVIVSTTCQSAPSCSSDSDGHSRPARAEIRCRAPPSGLKLTKACSSPASVRSPPCTTPTTVADNDQVKRDCQIILIWPSCGVMRTSSSWPLAPSLPKPPLTQESSPLVAESRTLPVSDSVSAETRSMSEAAHGAEASRADSAKRHRAGAAQAFLPELFTGQS